MSMTKVSLEACREMLVTSSIEIKAPLWKSWFSFWLEKHGWTMKEFEFAMRDQYKNLTGEEWSVKNG